MNKKLYILFFVLFGFILNIIFYIISDDYRYFLQSLKQENKYDINDDFKIDLNSIVIDKQIDKKNEDSIFAWLSRDFWNKKREKQENKKNIKKNYKTNIEKQKKEQKVVFTQKVEELKITKFEKEILEKLKKFDLKQIKEHRRLFDLTNEYPDKYFEYSNNKDFTLYIFWNKNFDDIKDIFEVLTYELPFSLNQVNNFWEKSFYINLDPLFDDNYVRIVIKKSSRVFWLKIKKELYNKIKNDLWVIFKK